jgi:hypothetical protein
VLISLFTVAMLQAQTPRRAQTKRKRLPQACRGRAGLSATKNILGAELRRILSHETVMAARAQLRHSRKPFIM